MLLNCGVGEDSWESLGLQGDPIQSILKEISPEYSLASLMLKLKLQYFGHLMWRADSLGKTLILGKIEGRRRRGWQRMRWLVGTTDSVEMSLSRLRKLVMDREAWCAVVMRSQRVGHDWATELNWRSSGMSPWMPFGVLRKGSEPGLYMQSGYWVWLPIALKSLGWKLEQTDAIKLPLASPWAKLCIVCCTGFCILRVYLLF